MHTVIVGGGIVGTAIAARLGSTDHEITVLERSEIGRETTAASAGLLMRTVVDPEPFDLRFRKRARERYRELREDGLETDRIGIVYVAESEAFADRLADSAVALREDGIEASVLEPDELVGLGIEPDGLAGGLYTPEDRVCDPAVAARLFADRARTAGVDVRTGVSVTDVETRDGAVTAVETSEGRLAADRVINAAGPWAPQLNEAVGIELPLCHTRGPMLAVETGEPLEGPTAIFESKRYVRPTETGAWLGAYRTDYVEGQRYDLADRSVSASFRDSARELEDVVLALEDATVVDDWVGYRTVTPDGRPLVGETTVEGYLVAVGLSGQGITLAPAVADVIGGDVDPEYRRRLSPTRFRG
ncbi:NAD(P)/FAD-dependent oxidoreductase [Natronococcus occultus]|uniref:Glycine/D-amino acid oxidase, deaminating n=1 Tax=Natronococcus occultus SP4 TaxID=694430 RepID=L0JXE8_9EURY|nr:FAD-dependent oxidoreductase [Natronococcus occultus]AGB37431.1 glycine/D-amino acid oxidase, deaminating [Natronococcus occultus SP4]